MVLEALGLEENSKSLVVPGTKDDDKSEAQNQDNQEEERDKTEDTRFRAIAARINYMSVDMPDIQFACKETCRAMAAPTAQAWARLKRLGRYLVGRPRAVWRFPWKDEAGGWAVFTDSDWAGDVKTRKSTSGGLILLGPHCLRSWRATQGAVALSSCEAEYYAVVEGATRAIGGRTAAEELGIVVADPVIDVLTVLTDSSAAKSLASRRGSGRVRHIETRWLWLQSAVAEGKVRMRKTSGATNPADVLTKFQSRSDMKEKLMAVNVELEEKEAPWRRRFSWADAEDDESELAAGWDAMCGSQADECFTAHVRGGVSAVRIVMPGARRCSHFG